MAASLPFLRLIVKEFSQNGQTAEEGTKSGKGSGGKGKYENLDDDWLVGTGNLDGGTRKGRLAMQDGKATVAYQ